MLEIVPNIESAYEDLRPVFLHALSGLARQGLAASPADAMDLIHDFFADNWESLTRNYNPEKGSFKSYAYIAFINFARPRILRLRRLQSSLVDADVLDSLAPEHIWMNPEFGEEHDRHVVINAIAQLPELERSVLSSYIYSEAPSERALAKEFGVSRYKLRELLVNALGRTVVLLDRPISMSERDWDVAQALWHDMRTVEETASYLGMTNHQVRQANSRNMHLLVKAIKDFQPRGRHRLRRGTMNPKQEILAPSVLLAQTLRSEGDHALLQQVTSRAGEIVSILETLDQFEMSDDELQRVNPLWIAEVYDALSKAVGRWEEAPQVSEKPFQAHEREEFQVGVAYRQVLIADLPHHLNDPDQWLGSVRKVSDEERDYALRAPSTQGGMPEAASLAAYGVTPLMVLRATQAVSFLLERFMRKGKLDSSAPVILIPEGQQAEGSLNPEMLVNEVKRMAECRNETARALYNWENQVAMYKPFIFNGFLAKPEDGTLHLYPTGERNTNLLSRWTSAGILASVSAH